MSFRELMTLVTLLLMATGCATTEFEFETPFGPRSADQIGPFEVLGVISRNTSTLNRSNAHNLFEEDVNINVPPGTELIVPAMRGWVMGFGSTNPANLGTDAASWNATDHNLGFAFLNIGVERINAVDRTTSPPTQTAVIRVAARLTDDNFDDRWFGSVNYTLICLGRRRAPVLAVP